MGLGNPSEGFQNSQAYQVPGLPFVFNASAFTKIEFPQITSSITITAIGGDCTVQFTAAAATANKFIVKSGSTVVLPLRVRDLWVTPASTMSGLAGLTLIPRSAMPELTAANWQGI